MGAFKETLDEVQQSFFNELFDNPTDISSLPKLLFVFNRPGRVGLLFQGSPFSASDVLDAEEITESKILVHEAAGATDEPYCEQLAGLFSSEFPELTSDDFVLHVGEATCLFACPILGLYTHGFEAKAVEPAVRHIINRIFELIEAAVPCTSEQQHLFMRHRDSWIEHGTNFITFKRV